ncbi:hypothetical protein M3Y94_01088100 [Aphelenchoides besseyi]|nr:hypothetical protein M3Y94_01088100 [Aphelenchoides besseyi]KAI6221742.1 hypothetical protein M3Y95_00994200 [Aphelenchoides besseyi]
MRKVRPSVTIEKLPRKTVYSEKPIHILPTFIDYTGHAEVTKYFRQSNDWSSFRGQPLHKTTVKTPSGFLIFTVAVNQKKSKKLACDSKSNQLTSWERDQPSGFTQHLEKTLEYLNVAKEMSED